MIIKYAHEINRGLVPEIESPVANRAAWDSEIDCLFIDSEEATLEQLSLIHKTQRVLDDALETGEQKEVRFGEDKRVLVDPIHGEIQISELMAPQAEDAQSLRKSVLVIPEKFKHMDLQRFSKTESGVEQLKELLKKIHPWSSLHYGLTATDSILRLYTQTIRKKLGDDCEIQVLTPQVRGSLGAVSLNQKIQETVNPPQGSGLQVKIGDRFFRVNDRVIQTRNNYDLGVFNGDIGKIVKIDPEDYSVEVQFAGESSAVIYQKNDLVELKLAYAITIHKSQGSEFEAVIIPVSTQHFKMLFRNLIYTGLTRAKKLVVFVGSRKALALAIKSIDNRKRQTAVSFLLASDNTISGSGLLE
jgi:exodeoxyribonuclease V alpha subunit